MLMPSTSSLLVDGFHLESALALAQACAVAYADKLEVEAVYHAGGFDRVDGFDKGDTQGFLASTRELTILAFRGTELNLVDWLRNLRVAPTGSAMGRVHSGFSIGLDMVWSDLLALCDRHQVDRKRFWITGHSLGAALATLAGQRFRQSGVSVSGFYTFGQPRLASAEFQGNFDSVFGDRFFRFINGNDIVPRIPPGYHHVRAPKRLTGDGGLEAVLLEGLRSEAAGEVAGPLLESDQQPLSDEQFELLMDYVDAQPEAHLLSAEDAAEAMQEGALPWISDHAISEYIRQISELTGHQSHV